MPELPEVETTRRGIEPHLLQQVISEIIVRQPSLRWPVPDDLEQRYRGQQITAVNRRGKYLLLDLSVGTIIIHLGMSGSLRVLAVDAPINKHDHLDVVLENETLLRFHDPRRFGSVLDCQDDPLNHPLLAKLGPEPLSEAFNADHLYQRSRGRKVAIKNFIMDSHTVVGIGNIYANECLFECGIHPTRAAGTISLERYGLIVETAKKILHKAIQQGGTTLRDFVNENGKPGYFQQQLKVYGRENEPCLICQSMVRRIQGQRSTWYCPQCQH